MRRRYLGIALPVLLLAILSDQTKAADNLQYDPQAEQMRQTFNQMLMDSHMCMHDAVRVMLRQGSRDSAQIFDFAEKSCGGMVMANREVFAPSLTKSEVQRMLREMAAAELDSVPGLSRTSTPRPGSR